MGAGCACICTTEIKRKMLLALSKQIIHNSNKCPSKPLPSSCQCACSLFIFAIFFFSLDNHSYLTAKPSRSKHNSKMKKKAVTMFHEKVCDATVLSLGLVKSELEVDLGLKAAPGVVFRVGLPLNLYAWEKRAKKQGDRQREKRSWATCLEWFKAFLAGLLPLSFSSKMGRW